MVLCLLFRARQAGKLLKFHLKRNAFHHVEKRASFIFTFHFRCWRIIVWNNEQHSDEHKKYFTGINYVSSCLAAFGSANSNPCFVYRCFEALKCSKMLLQQFFKLFTLLMFAHKNVFQRVFLLMSLEQNQLWAKLKWKWTKSADLVDLCQQPSVYRLICWQ